MQNSFHANCLPLLIGSLPMSDHKEANELVMNHTPEIPLWMTLLRIHPRLECQKIILY